MFRKDCETPVVHGEMGEGRVFRRFCSICECKVVTVVRKLSYPVICERDTGKTSPPGKEFSLKTNTCNVDVGFCLQTTTFQIDTDLSLLTRHFIFRGWD